MHGVETYERIRRAVLIDGMSQRAAAKLLGHGRDTIRKALEHSSPPGYRKSTPAAKPVIGPFAKIIDAWLAEDRKSPHRKQRHTGTRIWERLREDYEFTGSVSAVRRYIKSRQRLRGEVFFPLEFAPGAEAQVDWGEAWFILNGVETKAHLFCMRLCYSRATFVYAYPSEKMECFLDGHVRAFKFFGGVAKRCAYDNLRSAVIQVGRGRERTLNEKFIALRSHYLFASRFCNIACGNEKGHVENSVKLAQRTFMTPLPDCTSFEALSKHLEEQCIQDLQRLAPKTDKCRAKLFVEEQACLLPLPTRDFEACVRHSTFSSKQSLITLDTNAYSVPVRYAHHRVTYKCFPDRVEIWHEDGLIASHERSYRKNEYVLNFLHYIPLLARKPGGIQNGRPFTGEPWGEDFGRMRRELEFRYGGEGTKKFIRLLLLFTEYPVEAVKSAVRQCVRRRAFSDEAVKSTLNFQPRRTSAAIDLSRHPLYGVASDGIRKASEYDCLLGQEVSA